MASIKVSSRFLTVPSLTSLFLHSPAPTPWPPSPQPTAAPTFSFIRFTFWELLSVEEKTAAEGVGWTETTWDEPGSAPFEALSWSSLDEMQRGFLTELGYTEEIYDCYINHYDDYDWAELVTEGVSVHWEALGWSEASWNGDIDPPASNDMDWADLMSDEVAAAESLCYFQETWDGLPFDQW